MCIRDRLRTNKQKKLPTNSKKQDTESLTKLLTKQNTSIFIGSKFELANFSCCKRIWVIMINKDIGVS